MIKIKVFNKDIEFLIDNEDLDKIVKHNTNWSLVKNKYVHGWSKIFKRKVYLTQVILNYYEAEFDIDHIDKNTLNNQKYNLRLLCRSDNIRRSVHNGPNIKAIHRLNCSGWSASYELRFFSNNTTIYGGTFKTYEEAVNKYNELIIKIAPKISNEILIKN